MRQINLEEFVRRLKVDSTESTHAEKRFAIFLGAGCSVSSGIPAAAALVRDRWVPRLCGYQAPSRSDHGAWACEAIEDYDPADPARSYGALIDKLFFTVDDRQREIEDLCDGRTPSFGYAVLAQLVAQKAGRFNLVLTTNFDDLLADALYLYTDVRPLVIHHESLAAYIRPTRTRPLVVKLHGDHRLSPRNTTLETASLEQAIQQHTAMALHDRGIIFMGYSGADIGILSMLEALPREALPFGAFWVHPEEPQGPIRKWLESRQGVWVRSGWFDEVMLTIQSVFALPHPGRDRFDRIFRDYHEKFREISAAIEKKSAGGADVQALKKAIVETEARFPDFWRAISEAERVQETDPDKADAIYRDALAQFRDAAPLLASYARFLRYKRKDFDRAEEMFRRSIKSDPRSAATLGSYANFLCDQRKDFDAAETMYRKALDVEPGDARNLGNYAMFLHHDRRDVESADAMYKRALDADPTDPLNLRSYAEYLYRDRKDFDLAEIMYKRAIDVAPGNATSLSFYADFLAERRKDLDAAETLYQRALEVDPAHSYTLSSYASFLEKLRNDPEAAEPIYLRAIAADSGDAYSLSGYASFLAERRKDFDAAATMFERAIHADPANTDHFSEYAAFLWQRRNDYEAAAALLKRAIEVDPKDANPVVNLAQLLLVRGDADGLAILDTALALLAENPSPAAEVECLFYLIAHAAPDRRGEALRKLRALLESGVRSPDWDLSQNVARARQDGHPDSERLAQLAAVIGGAAEPEVLHDWPAWTAAR